MGFLEKKLAMAVIVHKPTTIHIGIVRLGSSATIGANIVAIRQTMLQIPREVAVNKVGKSAELPRYTMLKEEAIPN